VAPVQFGENKKVPSKAILILIIVIIII